jgi:hypothetical protein
MHQVSELTDVCRMNMRSRRFTSCIGAAVLIGLFAAIPAAGQSPTAAKFAAPRTPDGQPDMQGFWEHGRTFAGSIECEYDINGTTGNHENFNPPTDDKPRAPRQRRPSPCGADTTKYGNVALGLKIPLQPWARAKKDEMYKKIYAVGAEIKSPFDLDPAARCLPNGLPRTHALVGPHHILQPPGYVVILDEQAHQYRSIPVDGRSHVGSSIRLWMGDSTGRWEGNTLVVETSNFNGKAWWDMAATFHTEAQRTVERFTIVDADTIAYEIAFEDPKLLTEPFRGMTNTFKRGKKGDELLEEECLEGTRLENYGFK